MKNLTDEEKNKLYSEVYPIAIKFRETFIGEQEVIKDTFKMIEQLVFFTKIFGNQWKHFFGRLYHT